MSLVSRISDLATRIATEVKPISVTRSALNAARTGGTLTTGRTYLVSDENRLAFATAAGAYVDLPRQDDTYAVLSGIIGTGASVLTTGLQLHLGIIPYACQIQDITLLAYETGSLSVEFWKDSYANFPPVAGDKISASAPVSFSADVKGRRTDFSTWTNAGALAADDVISAAVVSVSTIKKANVIIRVRKI